MPAIRVPVIKTHQEIGELYVGMMEAEDLYAIAKADRIRLESLEVPKYAGFQRALVPERVDAIRDYLRTPRSTFPNAIILSISSDHIEEWEEIDRDLGVSVVSIERAEGAATIIDGQHRVAALDAAPPDFQVVVSLFIDLEMIRSAEIFAKINSTQKAVNPSIAFQLFGYAEERSPQRTAHDIATTLNTTRGSPFYKQLRMLGTKDEWSRGSLSQATFAKELMKLYTKDPMRDENRLLRKKRLDDYPGYPLRDEFIKGNDKRILEVVWRYFAHVAETWPDQWFDQTGTSILPKTTGYAALMGVLRAWLLGNRKKGIVRDEGVEEAFRAIREKYQRGEHRFIRTHYPAGNQGVQVLRTKLLADLRLE